MNTNATGPLCVPDDFLAKGMALQRAMGRAGSASVVEGFMQFAHNPFVQDAHAGFANLTLLTIWGHESSHSVLFAMPTNSIQPSFLCRSCKKLDILVRSVPPQFSIQTLLVHACIATRNATMV
jgi:hypothetical protein